MSLRSLVARAAMLGLLPVATGAQTVPAPSYGAVRIETARLVERHDPAAAADLAADSPADSGASLTAVTSVSLPLRLRRSDGNAIGVFWFQLDLPARRSTPSRLAIFIPRFTDGGTFYLNGTPLLSMPADSWWWWRAGHFLVVAAATATLAGFFLNFAGLSTRRWVAPVALHAVAGPVAVVASDGRLHEFVYRYWQAPLFIIIIWALGRFAWWGHKTRSGEALLITIGVVVAILLAANDYLTVSGLLAPTRVYAASCTAGASDHDRRAAHDSLRPRSANRRGGQSRTGGAAR